jgi:hypothetical protein
VVVFWAASLPITTYRLHIVITVLGLLVALMVAVIVTIFLLRRSKLKKEEPELNKVNLMVQGMSPIPPLLVCPCIFGISIICGQMGHTQQFVHIGQATCLSGFIERRMYRSVRLRGVMVETTLTASYSCRPSPQISAERQFKVCQQHSCRPRSDRCSAKGGVTARIFPKPQRSPFRISVYEPSILGG